MPIASKTPCKALSHRPISWAGGVVVTGALDVAGVDEALALVYAEKQRRPAAVAWLIDASAATRFEPAALDALTARFGWLVEVGVTQVALVLAPSDLLIARSVIPRYVPQRPGPQGTPVPAFGLRFFEDPELALRWFQDGCR